MLANLKPGKITICITTGTDVGGCKTMLLLVLQCTLAIYCTIYYILYRPDKEHRATPSHCQQNKELQNV